MPARVGELLDQRVRQSCELLHLALGAWLSYRVEHDPFWLHLRYPPFSFKYPEASCLERGILRHLRGQS